MSSFAALRQVIERQGLFGALYADRGSHYWLTDAAGGATPFQAGLFWCRRPGEDPLPAVTALLETARDRGVDARWVTVHTFDELIGQLLLTCDMPPRMQELLDQSRPPRRRGPLPGAGGLHRCRRREPPQGPEKAPAPKPRTRRDPRPAGHPALRHRPGRGLAPRAPSHPPRPRLVRGKEGPAGPARHACARHRRTAPRRPGPAPRHVAMAHRPRPPVPRRTLARLPRPFRHRDEQAAVLS